MFYDIYLGLKFSFSYFSILPIKFNKDDNLQKNSIIKYMIFFLPFVGFILGLIIVNIYIILQIKLGFVSYILCAILYMILYGFLHTEAILDVVDAIYAKHNNKDPYIVIKESTNGAMGILYGVSFLILKISAISYMFKVNLLYEFIAIIVFSRLSLLFNIRIFKFHAKSLFILKIKKVLSLKLLTFSFVVYLLLIYFFLNMNYSILFCILFTISISILTTKYLKTKLGFLNGDTLGTSLEFSELASLIFAQFIFIQ